MGGWGESVCHEVGEVRMKVLQHGVKLKVWVGGVKCVCRCRRKDRVS
jgi:hypothetical protein